MMFVGGINHHFRTSDCLQRQAADYIYEDRSSTACYLSYLLGM